MGWGSACKGRPRHCLGGNAAPAKAGQVGTVESQVEGNGGVGVVCGGGGGAVAATVWVGAGTGAGGAFLQNQNMPCQLEWVTVWGQEPGGGALGVGVGQAKVPVPHMSQCCCLWGKGARLGRTQGIPSWKGINKVGNI